MEALRGRAVAIAAAAALAVAGGSCANGDVKKTGAPVGSHCNSEIEVEMRTDLTDDNMRFVQNQIVYDQSGELRPGIQTSYVIYGSYLLCIKMRPGTTPTDVEIVANEAGRNPYVRAIHRL